MAIRKFQKTMGGRPSAYGPEMANKILSLIREGKSEAKICKMPGMEGEENFVGDSEIIALGGASNETKDRPLG